MRLPTPPEIEEAPELLALASVHSDLELMMRALVAAHPELIDEEPSGSDHASPLLPLAENIVATTANLQRLLDRYAEIERSLARERRGALDHLSF